MRLPTRKSSFFALSGAQETLNVPLHELQDGLLHDATHLIIGEPLSGKSVSCVRSAGCSLPPLTVKHFMG